MRRIIKHIFLDILRNRFVILYAVLLMLFTFSMYSLDSDPGKATLSLLNVTWVVVPMVSMVFTTVYFFNAYAFMELLLAQPLNRKTVFLSEFAALCGGLGLSVALGMGIPIVIYGFPVGSLILLCVALVLTWVFVSISMALSMLTRDKAKGIGISLMAWFYFAVIFDGLLLYLLYALSDYPIEELTLALTALNPVDIGRILVLMNLDHAALMGFSGAVFQQFIGTTSGMLLAVALLMMWIVGPLLFAWRKFRCKDL